MSRCVRVLCAPTVDNPHEQSFFFDLVIGNEGKMVSDHPIFGFEGELRKGRDSRPFVLFADGVIDYGDQWGEGNDRYGRVNLRDLVIAQGAIFKYQEFDGSGQIRSFRIIEIQDLLLIGDFQARTLSS